jgi:hypothetical protein
VKRYHEKLQFWQSYRVFNNAALRRVDVIGLKTSLVMTPEKNSYFGCDSHTGCDIGYRATFGWPNSEVWWLDSKILYEIDG